ncbi:MAG: hypothetical protein K2H76_01610, partial [Muribaculaceae bacterium]|nr:hypothetical protein [Muribaculaceae bacterium]
MTLLNLITFGASAVTEKPTYLNIGEKLIPDDGVGADIVQFIAHWTEKILDFLGIDHNPVFAMILYSILVLAIAIAIGVTTRFIILNLVKLIFRKSDSKLMYLVRKNKLISKLTAFIPPLAYVIFLYLTYIEDSPLINFLLHVTFIYIIYVSMRAINKIIDILWV